MRNKINWITLFLIMISVSCIDAQSLTICKSVDKEGHGVNASQEFTVAKNGGNVTFLVQFTATNKPASVSFDIYKLDKGKEIFSSTIKQNTEPSKNWLSKEITLYEAGSYRVYLYDDKDNLITKSNFTVKTL